MTEQPSCAPRELVMAVARSLARHYTHPEPGAQDQPCGLCLDVQATRPASHIVQEVISDRRNPLTVFLCCDHFGRVMGPVAARMCQLANAKPGLRSPLA